MNYYIEKHDMEMILDALELLRDSIKNRKLFGTGPGTGFGKHPVVYPYSEEDVDGLFQGLDEKYTSSF
jgi:hypothetical protein